MFQTIKNALSPSWLFTVYVLATITPEYSPVYGDKIEGVATGIVTYIFYFVFLIFIVLYEFAFPEHNPTAFYICSAIISLCFLYYISMLYKIIKSSHTVYYAESKYGSSIDSAVCYAVAFLFVLINAAVFLILITAIAS